MRVFPCTYDRTVPANRVRRPGSPTQHTSFPGIPTRALPIGKEDLQRAVRLEAVSHERHRTRALHVRSIDRFLRQGYDGPGRRQCRHNSPAFPREGVADWEEGLTACRPLGTPSLTDAHVIMLFGSPRLIGSCGQGATDLYADVANLLPGHAHSNGRYQFGQKDLQHAVH